MSNDKKPKGGKAFPITRTLVSATPPPPARSKTSTETPTVDESQTLRMSKTMIGTAPDLDSPAAAGYQAETDYLSETIPDLDSAAAASRAAAGYQAGTGYESETVQDLDSPVAASQSGSGYQPAETRETVSNPFRHGASDSLADQRVGKELGGYTILRKLAEGGMGVVYEAVHGKIGRKGAIKVLKSEFCQDPTVVERFYQEARAVNEIGHENIVDIFDFGVTPEGGVFFVMDFLEGMALSDQLRERALRWDESLGILRQIVHALRAAHAKGFVHRDLKPDNIFLEKKDGAIRVKLLDFGIAKLVGLDGAEDKLTRTGSMIGTPHYMSPEQINGSAEIDHRTDIYSLGVIIYEMYSGVTPFQGNTLGEIITGHLLAEPPRLTDLPADLGVPDPIADIIHRMLAKHPSQRYDTVDHVLSDLLDIDKNRPPGQATALNQSRPMTMVGARANPHTNPYTIQSPAPSPKRAKPWLPIAAGLGVAALAVGAIVLFGGTKEESRSTPAQDQKELAAAPTPEVPEEKALDYDAIRERAQSLIRGALDEAAPEARLRASDAAGDARDTGSALKLFELAQSDPDAEVRGHAAGALGKIGHADAQKVFAKLEKGASEPLKPWYADALNHLGEKKARKRLLKYAKSDNLAVAFKAALSLADTSQAGDESTIEALRRLAGREAELNELVPFAGAVLLSKLAALRSPGARGILYKILEQDNEAARLAAAEGLARLGDDGGAAVLRQVLASDDSKGRLRAAVTLVLLGDYSGYEVLNEKLASSDPLERAQAARGMGYLGEKRSLESLLPLLEDESWTVRIAASAALVAIVGLDPSLLAQASVDWARSALQSADWSARKAAADVLGDMPEKQAVPLLAQAMADQDAKVRTAAARSAAKMSSPDAARKVASAALIEKNSEAQEAQVRALGAIGQAEVADTLRTLSSDTGRVGVFASASLIAVGDESGKARLVEAVADKRTTIRMAAVESAAELKNPTVVPVLVTGVSDRVFDVRFVASEGLAKFGAEKALAVPVLETGLESKSVSIQARAQVGLAKFGVADVQNLSTDDLIASSDAEDRLAAVAVVQSQPWASARPKLQQLVADSDLSVRRASVDALATFAGDAREGVTKMFKTLTKDSDGLTRAKAQAQLAKLVEPVEKKVAKVEEKAPEPAVETGPSLDPKRLAELDAKIQSLETRAAALAASTSGGLASDAASLVALTQKPPVSKSETKMRRGLRSLRAEIASLSPKAEEAVALQAAIAELGEHPELQARKERLERVATSITESHAGAEALAVSVEQAEEEWASSAEEALTEEEEEEEVAPSAKDPVTLLADVAAAMTSSKFSSARKILKQARQRFQDAGAPLPGTYYFLDGKLNRQRADSTSRVDRRTRYLRFAQESYFKVLKLGSPEEIAIAKAQLAEIGPMLTDLLMAPEAEEDPPEEEEASTEGAPAEKSEAKAGE